MDKSKDAEMRAFLFFVAIVGASSLVIAGLLAVVLALFGVN